MVIRLRGDTYMTSAQGGGRGLPQKQTAVLISCVSVTVTRGEGGSEDPEIFAEVIKVSPLRL